jgi:Icc-related predicted phosphoesterase
VRVAVVADLHGNLVEVEPCDLLVVAGDALPLAQPAVQRAWAERELAPWLERQEAGAIIAVAGNCDLLARDDPAFVRSLPWHYLENEAAEVAGVHVWGSPLALPFGSWPFMAPEEELVPVWAAIPEETELVVVHGPPHGLGDMIYSGAHVGSPSLRERIDELPQLRAAVWGHIHEAHGRGRVGKVEWVNAAIVEDWRVEHAPEYFELAG